MDKELLKKNLRSAVEEYLSAPEAWDDALVAIDTTSAKVDLVEEEESENLGDNFDEYDIMDLVEMTPDGSWIPDEENIDSVVAEY